MEDQVRQLAAIATFGGNGIGARAVLVGLKFGDAPFFELGFNLCLHLFKAALGLALGVHLHPVQVARRTGWWSLPRFVVIPGTRHDTAHQGNGQQHEDGAEPGGVENIEKLKLVVDFCDAAIGGNEIIDIGFI